MKKTVFCLILSGIVILLMYFNCCNTDKINSAENDFIPIKLVQPEFLLANEPNDSLMRLALDHYKIQNPEIVLAQAKLESANYRSYLCKYQNNLFGLYNSAKGEYYSFNHWTESIIAYKEKIQYRYKKGDYYSWLKEMGYAEDPKYIDKLKSIVD